MKKTTRSVFIGLAMAATLSLAGSSIAGPSYAADQKLLTQSLTDLRAARSKLHHVERDFGGSVRRAEKQVEETIEAVEAAVEHAKHHQHDDD